MAPTKMTVKALKNTTQSKEPEIRSFCLSLSKRNKDILEIVDEYREELMLSKANTVCKIIREYPSLKRKAEIREMQAYGLK